MIVKVIPRSMDTAYMDRVPLVLRGQFSYFVASLYEGLLKVPHSIQLIGMLGWI